MYSTDGLVMVKLGLTQSKLASVTTREAAVSAHLTGPNGTTVFINGSAAVETNFVGADEYSDAISGYQLTWRDSLGHTRQLNNDALGHVTSFATMGPNGLNSGSTPYLALAFQPSQSLLSHVDENGITTYYDQYGTFEVIDMATGLVVANKTLDIGVYEAVDDQFSTNHSSIFVTTDTNPASWVVGGPQNYTPYDYLLFKTEPRIHVLITRTGVGHGSLTWSLNGVSQSQVGEPVAFDPTFPIPDRTYTGLYRVNAGNGDKIELSKSPSGISDVPNAEFVQIHKGNYTTDSAGCIVGSLLDKGAFYQLMSKLSSLSHALPAPQGVLVTNIIHTSQYIAPASTFDETKIYLSHEIANAGTVVVTNNEEFYPGIPITVTIEGKVVQPKLALHRAGKLELAPDGHYVQPMEVNINGLPAGTLDRNIKCHIEVFEHTAIVPTESLIETIKVGLTHLNFTLSLNSNPSGIARIVLAGYDVLLPGHHRHNPYTPVSQPMLNLKADSVGVDLHSAVAQEAGHLSYVPLTDQLLNNLRFEHGSSGPVEHTPVHELFWA